MIIISKPARRAARLCLFKSFCCQREGLRQLHKWILEIPVHCRHQSRQHAHAHFPTTKPLQGNVAMHTCVWSNCSARGALQWLMQFAFADLSIYHACFPPHTCPSVGSYE